MEGTSGTPHLLTDVRFSVSRKGYDPDEVDNFLERVSAAVAQLQDKLRQAAAQAESAEVRATEAARARDGLQQRIQELEAELAATREGVAAAAPMPARSPEEDVEQASTVLLMAQRTADAAIEEANAAARSTLADARSQATAALSDAQQEADRLLAQARSEAESIVTRRRETLAEEVRGLESVRDAVTADLATLEVHAGEQREALQAAVARLQSVLDDPSAFRVGLAPGLISGASASDVLVDDDATPGAGPSAGDTSAEPEATAEPDVAPEATAPEPEPWAAEAPTPAEADVAADDATEAELVGGPPTDQVPAAVIFDEEATEAVPAADGGSLFGSSAREEGDDDSPLGPPDDEADAAMRAFFEAEFDDDPGR